uniref:Uncharacterized protein n=1 Tax=Amazona collaria TaxID=241587 RepID=A0A8B9IZP3_9PSIT
MADSLRRLVSAGSGRVLQEKLESWYRNYEVVGPCREGAKSVSAVFLYFILYGCYSILIAGATLCRIHGKGQF